MKALRQALLILLLALPPAAVVGFIQIDTKQTGPGTPAAPLAQDEIDLATAKSWDSVLWVDARARAQFDEAHIPGAVPLSEEEWDDDLVALFDQWKPDRKVVVYCDSAACDKSRQVAARLRSEVGLENVHWLRGGWDAWKKEGPQP